MIQLRASSLPDLLDCPARWEAKHLRKLRFPKSGSAHLGTAIHAGAGAFDLARIEGSPITADEAAGEVVDVLYHPEEDVDWGEDSPGKLEKTAVSLLMTYCADIAPDHDYVAVEGRCDDLELTDLDVCLTGTCDRIYRTEAGEHGIADIKTGGRAVGSDGKARTAGHAAQMGAYEILAERTTGIPMTAPAEVIGLQTAKTKAGQRVGVGEIHGAKDLLLGTEEAPGLLQFASQILKSSMFYGNARSMLCNDKFCPAYAACRFRR